MMNYEVGQEFVVNVKRMGVKIISRQPGAQLRTIPTKGVNYYEVELEGKGGKFKTMVSEPVLELLTAIQEMPEKKAEPPKVEPPATAKKAPVKKKKKKRTRRTNKKKKKR